MGREPMTDAAVDALRDHGVFIARRCLAPEDVNAWREAAEARYAAVDAVSAQSGPWAVSAALGLPFVPTASSLGLSALGALAQRITDTVANALGPAMSGALDGPFRSLGESAWLRRQFAPRHAPPHHAPHAWHQDGGLGFDYLGDADLADGLLPMVTCWCPLVPCGEDAPGMAYLPHRPRTLLSLARLAGVSQEAVTPRLGPGDVLMMMGDLVHRTHVAEAMSRDRISVELRFVPADHPCRRGPWSGAPD